MDEVRVHTSAGLEGLDLWSDGVGERTRRLARAAAGRVRVSRRRTPGRLRDPVARPRDRADGSLHRNAARHGGPPARERAAHGRDTGAEVIAHGAYGTSIRRSSLTDETRNPANTSTAMPIATPKLM